MTPFDSNVILLTDSYKAGQWKQYPPGTTSVYSYFESRDGARFDETVFFGLQYLLKRYLCGPVVTTSMIDEAEAFFDAHVGPGIFNRAGWEHILEAHDGRLPVEVRAVPEGTAVPTSNVMMTVENTDPECYWLTSYLETLLVQLWHPSTVATTSRHIKGLLAESHDRTAGNRDGLDYRLHDFGFRGVGSVETAALAGAGHLVNFHGTDNVPAVRLVEGYYSPSGMPAHNIPACYDDETEVLTDRGFIRFAELQPVDKVAQYEQIGAGFVRFVPYTNLVREPYQGDMVRFYTDGEKAAVDLLVTPNHRMVRRSKATGEIEVSEAADATFSDKNEWLQAGLADADDVRPMTALDRLRIAFQADGSFVSRPDAYTGSRTGTKPVRFSLKKRRKIKRLRWILNEIGVDYSESAQADDYVQFWVPLDADVADTLTKDFSWVDLAGTDSEWFRDFVVELVHWDGTEQFNTVVYSSTVESCVDVAQAAAVLAGFRASKSVRVDARDNRSDLYVLNVSLGRSARGGQNIRKEVVPYDGNIHCVTVPSGMLVVRRNGYVSVSGNSEHSTMTSWGRGREAQAYANMLEAFPTGLVSVVSDSYDILAACKNIWGNALRDKVLERDGILVVRPDSGFPPKVVLQVLDALTSAFGATRNSQGYQVLNPKVRVIQGDGIDPDMVVKILDAMHHNGFATENLTLGSGGGLLQKMNRDTQRFVFKCSHTKNGFAPDGMDVYKDPAGLKGSNTKTSKRGRLSLVRGLDGLQTVPEVHPASDLLRPVFRDGRLLVDDTFDAVRRRAALPQLVPA